MADTKPTIREALWTHLNPLGRVLIVLITMLGLGHFLSMVFNWEPFESFLHREPSVADYVATVFLLMIDVPLGWAALKAQRSDTARRVLVVIYVAVIFMTMLEMRFALEKEERWHTRTELILLFSLIIAASGIGRRRLAAPAADSSPTIPIDP